MALKKRNIEIIGIPVDLGAGRRGVDMGPSAIRIADLEVRLESLGHKVTDYGDIDVMIPEMEQKCLDERADRGGRVAGR